MAKQPSNFIALPSTGGGPSTQTFEGLASGMNVALPPQELDDTSARYLQDILLDQPGLIRRRGPLNNSLQGFPNTDFKAVGAAYTLDPQGTSRLGILTGDATHGHFQMLNTAFTAVNATDNLGFNLTTNPPSSPYPIVDVKSALNQGAWIGTSNVYTANSPVQSLMLWRGGNNADYATGTLTVARGSTAVTGAGTTWTGNVSPGMFLFGTTDDGYTLTLIGVVAAVTGNTTLTLEGPSPYPMTAKAYNLTSIRGFQNRVTVGSITCATSAATVTGANTKFTTQLSVGTWNLYRATDMTWIGKVSTIANNSGLTLAANAAINMTNEFYVALRADGDWTYLLSSAANKATKVGFLNANYAEVQWYGNCGSSPVQSNRVYFSDANDPENVDMSGFDGNFITVSSTANYSSPLTGMAPAYNALLVFKENETFGIFGNSPSTFNVQKIEDDGALNAGSIQSYGGGVLWAGRTGIFFYDGVQATNIVAGTLGNWWKELVRTVDPTKYRMWSAMARDHYFLFLEQANPTVPIVKGNVTSSPSHLCIVINMISHAPTIFTNFSIRGGVQMPFSTGLETLFLVNQTATGSFYPSANIFNATGADAITCDTDSAPGPDFYIETKKYNAGDSLILKLWSQLLVNYRCGGDALNVDTVVGLNNIGATSATQLTPTTYTWDTLKANYNTWNFLKFSFSTWATIGTSFFKPKRVRFLKRSQNFAFRIWQNSSAVSDVTLGPFQIGFKQMRPGRI